MTNFDKPFYVYQHEQYGLGNFIALTPTIRKIYENTGEPVPVLFTNKYVRECYEESPVIKAIEEPHGVRLLGSDMICYANSMTDYDYVYQMMIGKKREHEPFIPVPDADAHKPHTPNEYAVLVNGSGSEAPSYLNRKLIPQDLLLRIDQELNMPVIAVGSVADADRMPGNIRGYFGNIKESLSLIFHAQLVITNVTGFYHAAGAMRKNQIVLWKDCATPRCKNVNPNQTIIPYEEWDGEWLSKINKP